MPSWNVKLETKRRVVRVINIINEKPDFIVVQLSNGKPQKLSDSNFPRWRQVKKGREIELIIRESVVEARLLSREPEEFQKSVKEFFNKLQNRTAGLFFMWVCEHCQAMGYVAYEDGAEPQGIKEHIEADHKKSIIAWCDKTKFKIYDHRGTPQRDSAFIVSLTK